MAWFSYLQSTDNLLPSTVSPSLRREINFDNLENSLFENEIVAVKLNNVKVNTKLSTELDIIEDNDSYIVIYEDFSNEDFFIATKSRVVDDYIYFKVIEDLNKDNISSKKYSIYYGLNNLKYLNELSQYSYQQATTEDIAEAVDGDYYDLAPSDVPLAYYEVTKSSEKSFQLALYDDGNSWSENKSTKPGAKAFGIFDGPNLYILGSKGTDFGKFRIRIFEVLEDGTVTKTTPIDWQEVDCFSYNSSSNQILFQTEEFLEYKRYMFEIEVISEKNLSSTSNAVEISKYKFIPNYKIYIEPEELNPDASFIRIGGIR